jgi:pimeloyl-ACP methyl ester carboxylesterase
MAVYEVGRGPAVIFLHGFPELAFSWRYQLPALAAAGYRAIAPDQRGYGQTACPAGIDNYTAEHLIGDVEGLLDALGLECAIFVGHDWGALLLWRMALVRPQRIERQVILNVPFYPRPSRDPVQIMRERLGDRFYIVDFQDSQDADREFAADPAHFFDVMMRRGQITRARFDQLPPDKKVLSLRAAMARDRSAGEPLLSDAERDYFAGAFARSGFTGPINWYRNWTHNWQTLEGVEQRIEVPTLFIGAVDDVIVAPRHIEAMKPFVTRLEIRMIDNCGHWTQQEHPDAVNRLIVEWLGRGGT